MNKKFLERFFLVPLGILGFVHSASFAAEAKDPFMEIAEELSVNLEDRKVQRIAVGEMKLINDQSSEVSRLAQERLIHSLNKTGRVSLIERDRIDEIRKVGYGYGL